MNGWEFAANPPFSLNSSDNTEQARVAWEQVQQQLPAGTMLSGRVFARTHFGVFYDAGVGFPVRINVTDFGKPEGVMVFPEDYPTLNSFMRGEVSGFEDRGEGRRQIVTVRDYKRWCS